jgi:hypothetical protein
LFTTQLAFNQLAQNNSTIHNKTINVFFTIPFIPILLVTACCFLAAINQVKKSKNCITTNDIKAKTTT